MLFSSTVLAFVLAQLGPTKQPEAPLPEAPTTYSRLETMQRMLQRQLEAHRDEILGATERPAGRGSASDAALGTMLGGGSGAAGNPGSVADDFVTSLYAMPSVASSQAEYVPGLAAVFSLTVPVRTEWIAEEAKQTAETETPNRDANELDDAAWEALASGRAVNWALGRDWKLLATARGAMGGRNVPAPRQQRFSAAAVDALQRTLLDTIWRFGHKLELNPGERIAVVVQVHPASSQRWMRNAAGGESSGLFDYTTRGYGTAGSPGAGGLFQDPTAVPGTITDPNGAPVNGAVGAADGDADGFTDAYWRGALNPWKPARPFRLVLQVSADDLAAYRSGTLDRDDTAKRTRVQRFAEAAGDVTPAPPPGGGAR